MKDLQKCISHSHSFFAFVLLYVLIQLALRYIFESRIDESCQQHDILNMLDKIQSLKEQLSFVHP